MNKFIMRNSFANKVGFDEENLIVYFTDGRKLYVPLAFFPRLLNATDKQRKNYIISGGGSGIHWDELDEDISVKHLLWGFGDQTIKSDSSAA